MTKANPTRIHPASYLIMQWLQSISHLTSSASAESEKAGKQVSLCWGLRMSRVLRLFEVRHGSYQHHQHDHQSPPNFLWTLCLGLLLYF